MTAYFTERMHEYCNNYWLGVDINLLDIKECEIAIKNESTEKCFIDNQRDHFRENMRGFHDGRSLPEKTGRKSDESIKYKKPLIKNSYASKSARKSMKMFEKVEGWNGGFTSLYSVSRMFRWQKSAEIESVNLQDEIQQGLIDKRCNGKS